MMQAIATMNKFLKRNLRNYFESWKDKLILQNKAIKIFDKFFSKNRVYKQL